MVSPCFGAKLPIVTLVGIGVIAGSERLIADIRIELKETARVRAPADQIAVEHTSRP
jgi:hypothetical protein